jgi:hypothetical protein
MLKESRWEANRTRKAGEIEVGKRLGALCMGEELCIPPFAKNAKDGAPGASDLTLGKA